MAERCFRYNSLLLLELHAPVLTTVLYLSPPGPPKGELVYRVILGGVEVNSWHFDVVRLWEIKAETALASGAPGLMVLVPLLDGGNPVAVGRAAEQIQHLAPEQQVSELEIILWLLARQRYNIGDLARGIGRNKMNALLDLLRSSPGWKDAEAIGEARARAELLAVERELCIEIVSRSHPEQLADVSRHIQPCDDPAILRKWILAASEPDGEALTRLIAEQPETAQ